ncbi:efflux RND transporter periplasmic adaptor subunit [Sulfitobacter sp. D35]|uniref:efflux RND transporter periplasmic adaptor subunit n=1 Tax=Sulfitobacter sp. D35 TaxID=3083252 RepID=UPI00297002B5|nr:efflux RND transporter periplasmic adaptor subunit [Sulfitobacter sp. D35]MDW4497126.1 efflux RND transporter periplasmic adaptor subunit [Sulfitobacter sp. D35]
MLVAGWVRTAVTVIMLFPLCAAAQDAPPPTVLTIEVARDSIRPEFEHPARIEAVQTASVRPIVSGQITALHFTAGEIVDKDTLLIELDDTDFRIAVAEAEANLKQAEAAVVKADADLDRAQQLVERETVSERDVEFAQADSDVAHAQREVARARLDQAKKNLDDTKIAAPFTGRIGAPNYAVGDLFAIGDPTQPPAVATIVSLDPIYAVGLVDQTNYFDYIARRLRLDAAGVSIPPLELSLVLPGDSIYAETGKFENWDNTAAASTGTIAARVLFPNPDGLLLPGENVTLRGELIEPVEAVVVPQRAVGYDQLGHFVWIVGADGAAQRRDVEVGIRTGSNWTIATGLDGQETVIVEGLQKVREGAPVTSEAWEG